jgi:PhnB protein
MRFVSSNLSLMAEDSASGQRYFNALAEGGQLTLPFQATFCSKGLGIVVDRFVLMGRVTLPPEASNA